jgi:Family of unknown function (DUF5670)
MQRLKGDAALTRRNTRYGAILGRGRYGMFLILAVVLLVMWIGGFVMFKSAGLLIHILLIFAVISLVLHLVSGRRSA